MGKQVPLVMYTNGHRIILGAASVQPDGSILAQINKDRLPEVRALVYEGDCEFSIVPLPASPGPNVDRYTQPAYRASQPATRVVTTTTQVSQPAPIHRDDFLVEKVIPVVPPTLLDPPRYQE